MFAEYDPQAAVMVSVMDTPGGERRPTGAMATPGVELLVLPLRVRWPDPYLPDLPQLLGPIVIDHDQAAGELVQTFPAAAFTPEAVRAARITEAHAQARQVLGLTDWVVIRQLETGRPAPAHLSARRAAVRSWHQQTLTELSVASPAQLAGAHWGIPPELAQP